MLLLSLFIFATIGNAQDTTVNKSKFDSIVKASAIYKAKYDSITSNPILKPEPAIQGEINNNIVAALKEVVSYIDYLFILIFIITAFIINLFISADGLANSLNWMRKWKSGWIFIWGILLTVAFIYLFNYNGKLEIFGLVFSLMISMGLYKVVGLDAAMRAILGKLGLKLPAPPTT